MANNDENREVILTNEDGVEEKYEIMLTFESEDFGKSYVLLYKKADEDKDEVEVYAYSFEPDDENAGDLSDNGGKLNPIETQEELDMIEQVMNTFSDDENNDNN